jgi:GTPase-activating protein
LTFEDLKRTFPNKDLNNEDELIKKMKNILTYYARYKLLFHKKRERRNPHIGYCQGMNFIAAKILNVVPEEEVMRIVIL